MNVQVKRIATMITSFACIKMASAARILRTTFGVPYQTINQVVEYMGLLPVNKNDLAPSRKKTNTAGKT
jgi:hypothetical protein